MRAVHLPALKAKEKRGEKVNVTAYVREWNKSCAKGEELSDGMRCTLSRWLSGGVGSSFVHSQTRNAKANRRFYDRKVEVKKVVKQTTETFFMD